MEGNKPKQVDHRRRDIDQSPEQRTPTHSPYIPIAASTIMRVVDMQLRFPEAKVHEIAEMTGIERHCVGKALTTPMALARMESAYDVRALVQQRLRTQALNSFEVLAQVQIKALKMLEEEGVNDAALLAAATRTSLDTLKGVGILKDHSIEETQAIDTKGVTELLGKADSLREAIMNKLEQGGEDVEETEGVGGEDVEAEREENHGDDSEST